MAFPHDPLDPFWTEPFPLPEKITSFRPAQIRAVEEISAHFEAGKRIVVLDAPTGSGKTLVGEVVRRINDSRAFYLCVDRGLQDQVMRDFIYAKVLKGRSNYPTLNYPDRFRDDRDPLSAADCNRSGDLCSWCVDVTACPYTIAKREALGASLACLNTAYFLLEANGPGGFSFSPTGNGLIIVDEGDRLEDVLMNYVEVSLSEKDLNTWGIVALTKVATIEETVKWVERVGIEVGREAASFGVDERDWEGFRDLSLRDQRRLRHLRALDRRLEMVAEEYATGGWVTVFETDRGTRTIFRPVTVDRFAPKALWAHAPRWLLMSATVLSAERMLKDLGVTDPNAWATVTMPSSFDPSRRPVVALNVYPVTYKHRDIAPGKIAERVNDLLAQHADERVLVHTFSYQLQRAVIDGLHPQYLSRLVTYAGANSRTEALAEYLERPASILIAPALERGIDLPDDACRVIIICKVPYPFLGDPQVAARQRAPGGEDWYLDQTVRSLVQMTGRGMRHAEDSCVSYILDSEFNRIFRQDIGRYQGPRFPAWWTDAVRL